MRELLPADRPGLALAPMQDVTDLPFLRVMARRGGPDYYVTEYFRVYPGSRLERYILRSVDENPTGRPLFAQMIGGDVDSLVRSARELMRHPVAGVDLNLGCPSPTVCRKSAGGGLLRDLGRVDRILGALREVVDGRFTVKTRLGYERPEEFEGLLEVFRRHAIDGLAVHGRTVVDRYQTPVWVDWVRRAVEGMACPVVANGNVVNVTTGVNYQRMTGAAGLMIGRGAIRNPWIFRQLADAWTGREVVPVVLRDLWEYVGELYDELARETRDFQERHHVQRMKRYLVYVSQGVGEEFEGRIRRVATAEEFFAVCRAHLDAGDAAPVSPPEKSKIFCGFGDLERPA